MFKEKRKRRKKEKKKKKCGSRMEFPDPGAAWSKKTHQELRWSADPSLPFQAGIAITVTLSAEEALGFALHLRR